MKNEHLVPVNVQDLVEKMKSQYINENERLNYQLRVEAIKEFCENALAKPNTINNFLHKRSKTR